MKSIWIILILCFFIPFESIADTCSKPKVGVIAQFPYEKELIEYLNRKFPSQPKESWLRQIREKVLSELRMNSPDIQFVPINGPIQEDCEYEFTYGLSPWGKNDFLMDSKLAQKNACGFMGNKLGVKNTTMSDIFKTIECNIDAYGSISNMIREYEESHPVPPRGPELEVSLNKDYVSPLKEEREINIKVYVRNCRGEPVYDKRHGQEVILPRYTKRGEIKPSSSTEGIVTDNTVILKITNPNGGSATYTLKKGMETSEDPLKVLTCGIDKKVVKEVSIPIDGVVIEAKPKDAVISPGEKTDIEIWLFKKSLKGIKIPVPNQNIDITIKGLVDGTVSPRGKVTTDNRGKAVLTYRAGEKESKVEINAKYQPEGYPDFITAQTFVEVEPQKCWTGTVQMIVNSKLNWEDEKTNKFNDGAIRDVTHEKITHFRNYHIVVQFYFDRKKKGVLLSKSVDGRSSTHYFIKHNVFGRCRKGGPWEVVDQMTKESIDETKLIDNIKDIVVLVDSSPESSLFTFAVDPSAIMLEYSGTTYPNWKERQRLCKGATERVNPIKNSYTAALSPPFAFVEKKNFESNVFGGEKTIVLNDSFSTTVRGSIPNTVEVKYIWGVWRTKCRE